MALTTRALKVSPSPAPPPSAGPVHRLGGEAAGVQQVHPAPLQAEPGGRRLVCPLQGAAGHGPLPRPQVIQVTLKVSFFKTNKTLFSLCKRTKKEFRGTEKIFQRRSSSDQRKRQRPLVFWRNPNSLVRASDVFAFAAPCFSLRSCAGKYRVAA